MKFYQKNIFNYFGVCLLYAITAIVLALLVNQISSKIQNLFNITSLYIRLFLNLILSILALYIIEMYISRTFSNDWQITTPGFIFVALFFGTQALQNNIGDLTLI